MKFICDDNLGRLAKWLRTLGHDTLFYSTISDQELIKKALEEERVILTRDNNLIQMKAVQKYLLIKSDQPLEQLKQVVQHFKLKKDEEKLFTRCSVCNTELKPVEKEKIKHRLYPYVSKTQENFVYCSFCDKIYWPATHVEHMKQKLKNIFIE
jgi:uncharacterized protein with PIN domain